MARIRIWGDKPAWFSDSGGYLRPATEAEHLLIMRNLELTYAMEKDWVSDRTVLVDVARWYDEGMTTEEEAEWLKSQKSST